MRVFGVVFGGSNIVFLGVGKVGELLFILFSSIRIRVIAKVGGILLFVRIFSFSIGFSSFRFRGRSVCNSFEVLFREKSSRGFLFDRVKVTGFKRFRRRREGLGKRWGVLGYLLSWGLDCNIKRG